MKDCTNLKAAIYCYAAASGQIFNYDKSLMIVSGDISASQMDIIKNIFQLHAVLRHEKYLGLSSMVGRKKISFFNDIKINVINKISKWNNKLFSSGGNEILIKDVAQAVLTYAISIFKLPLRLCKDI